MNTFGPLLTLSAVLIMAACSRPDVRAEGQAAPPQAKDCVGDLDFAASFLLHNDAGLRGLGWKAYSSKADKVIRHERVLAAQPQSVSECVARLNRFLGAIRRGHLVAVPSQIPVTAALGSNPRYARHVVSRRLSSEILYIEVPSFDDAIREQVLRLVEDNRDALRAARGLIIDLRHNGGGRDTAIGSLLELLGPETYRIQNPDILVTPANLAAFEAFALQNPSGVEQINGLIARMKAADRGWVRMSDDAVVESRYDLEQVKATPERVVLLIGPECASSCEQFVMEARQNERVTLMGRRTFGALDASNLFPAQTPSGQITLWYATTFVRRPHGQIIDDLGIPPDMELSPPADEAAFAAEVAIAKKTIEDGMRPRPRDVQQAVPERGRR